MPSIFPATASVFLLPIFSFSFLFHSTTSNFSIQRATSFSCAEMAVDVTCSALSRCFCLSNNFSVRTTDRERSQQIAFFLQTVRRVERRSDLCQRMSFERDVIDWFTYVLLLNAFLLIIPSRGTNEPLYSSYSLYLIFLMRSYIVRNSSRQIFHSQTINRPRSLDLCYFRPAACCAALLYTRKKQSKRNVRKGTVRRNLFVLSPRIRRGNVPRRKGKFSWPRYICWL